LDEVFDELDVLPVGQPSVERGEQGIAAEWCGRRWFTISPHIMSTDNRSMTGFVITPA